MEWFRWDGVVDHSYAFRGLGWHGLSVRKTQLSMDIHLPIPLAVSAVPAGHCPLAGESDHSKVTRILTPHPEEFQDDGSRPKPHHSRGHVHDTLTPTRTHF